MTSRLTCTAGTELEVDSRLAGLQKLTKSCGGRYLATSGPLLWSLALVFLIARPAFAFLEQFWLRRASSAKPVLAFFN